MMGFVLFECECVCARTARDVCVRHAYVVCKFSVLFGGTSTRDRHARTRALILIFILRSAAPSQRSAACRRQSINQSIIKVLTQSHTYTGARRSYMLHPGSTTEGSKPCVTWL